jgi:hypothetical protein
MKLIKFLLLIFPSLVILYSCVHEKDEANLYYKSTFLGSDSFQLKGNIFSRNGNPITGNKISAKINKYDLNDWNIEGTLNDSEFSITINKTDGKGNSLPIFQSDDDYYRYDTVWERFTAYFFAIGNNYDSERDKKMYTLNIFLDEDEDKGRLYEFVGDKPTKYFNYSIFYVYIPEPVTISGTYNFEDESFKYHYSFDCDFSKPGWYKIFEDLKPIGKNQSYTTSVNTRYYKD